MGKFSVGKSIASKVVSATGAARKLTGLVGGGASGLSQLSSLKGIPGLNVDAVASKFESGPLAGVTNMLNAASSNPKLQAVNKMMTDAEAKSNEFMSDVSNKLMDKVKASGIQDNPEVKKMTDSLNSKLAESGLDLGTVKDLMGE